MKAKETSIFWSASTKGFYDSDLHNAMPTDVVEIGHAERERLLNGQASGATITSDTTGRPMLVAPRAITTADMQGMALTTARMARAAIMSRLDGLQASALATKDSKKAASIEDVKQGLRDVTKTDLSGLSTVADMQKALDDTFAQIASDSASEEVQRAFK